MNKERIQMNDTTNESHTIRDEIIFVNSAELSKITSIPVYTIRKLTREGILLAYNFIGKKYLYDISETIAIIKKSRLQSNPKNTIILPTRTNISPKGDDV
jgi:hypothetical protein